MSVLRRSGRPRPISFSPRNERPAPAWGDPPAGYGWRFARFAVVWTAVMALAAHIGLNRGGW